ncbi:hypothetical protein BJ912DRAFT_862426, partial [Pholiota molesta]
DDPKLIEALNKYHREGKSNNKVIAQCLLADYGIVASKSTVKRRRKQLGLKGSGATTREMPHLEKLALILHEMDLDPSRGHGLDNIRARIAFDFGIHLTRDFISDVMHTQDAEGFHLREPGAKKIPRTRKNPIGIHERWSGDGHDKLNSIGFPIWAVVDEATSKWLGGWVLPSNRLGTIIAYVYLCLVETYGGMPLQFTTDCGSETTQAFGYGNALRELCQWLWPKLLQQELNMFMDFRNGVKMRRDKYKAGRSGFSRNDMFSLHSEFDLQNCLLPVDITVIQEMKEDMGGDALLSFVPLAFAECANAAYMTLGVQNLSMGNVWAVFRAYLSIYHIPMATKCARCNFVFPRLDDGSNCAKCAAMKPGLSIGEIAAINVSTAREKFRLMIMLYLTYLPNLLDYASVCGMWANHSKPSTCDMQFLHQILYFGSCSWPPDGFRTSSNLVDTIISSARVYQAQASGSRLAQAPIAYARTGLNGIKTRNLDIAAQVTAERKAKSEETKHLDTGIRITAGLWESHKNKISQIKEFTKIELFDPNVSAKAAFDKLLISLRSNFEVKNPTAQQLTWSNISLFAHENQNRFSSLQNCDLATSLGQFFKAEFIRKKIGTKRKLDNREIEIRLMYERVKISDSEAPQSEDDSFEFLGSKRKRGATQASAYTSKRLQPPSLTSKAASSSRPAFLKSSYKARSDDAVILKSAYKPRAPQVQWSKDVDTTSCQFFRISATYDIKTCQVELSPEATDAEDIEIATKWENKKDGGYVGIGYTKRGIYARFAGREYVITQPFEGTAENVRHVLEEEYKLLCQCHGFKGAFDDFAKDRKMRTIPSTRKLPYQYFIATPLLPYGDADPKIKKFTGNGEIGIPQDDITKAIHAFAHFSVVYSHSGLLFCDLQGMCVWIDHE